MAVISSLQSHCFFSTTNAQRGRNFEENCVKADVDMDDILPGLIIEGVLGVQITHIPELSDNFYNPPVDDPAWYKRQVDQW